MPLNKSTNLFFLKSFSSPLFIRLSDVFILSINQMVEHRPKQISILHFKVINDKLFMKISLINKYSSLILGSRLQSIILEVEHIKKLLKMIILGSVKYRR